MYGLGFADTSQPVVLDHPLNRDLVFWWLNLPQSQWRGGKARDLMRRFDMDPDTPGATGWVGPKGRLGGYGAGKFTTADTEKFTHPSDSRLEGFTELTLMAWIHPTEDQTLDTGRILSKVNGSGSDDYHFGWVRSAVSDKRTVEIRITTSSAINLKGGTQCVVGEWAHAAARWENTTGALETFRNGFSQATGTKTGTLNNATDKLCLGGHANSTTRFFPGLIDDVRLYRRFLTKEEINSVIEESKRGHPNTINWVRRSKVIVPAAVTGFFPSLALTGVGA